MNEFKRRLAQYEIRDYFFILCGTLLYGFAFNGFILSNEIVTGGLSGLCALIFFATGETIPVSVSYFVINIFLLGVALKILGLRFLIKTIFGVFALSGSLSLFETVLDGPIIEGEPFMSIIIGGALCGSGLGMIFASNGSTGGTDIIGMIITKYKNISIGRAMLMLDFFIIGSSYFLFHDVTKIVFAFVEMVVSNYMIDQIVNGNRESVQFFIISEKYEEIVDRVINDMDRSCTILDGHGGYTKKPVKVLLVLVRKSESVNIFRFIKSIDPPAGFYLPNANPRCLRRRVRPDKDIRYKARGMKPANFIPLFRLIQSVDLSDVFLDKLVYEVQHFRRPEFPRAVIGSFQHVIDMLFLRFL